MGRWRIQEVIGMERGDEEEEVKGKRRAQRRKWDENEMRHDEGEKDGERREERWEQREGRR